MKGSDRNLKLFAANNQLIARCHNSTKENLHYKTDIILRKSFTEYFDANKIILLTLKLFRMEIHHRIL